MSTLAMNESRSDSDVTTEPEKSKVALRPETPPEETIQPNMTDKEAQLTRRESQLSATLPGAEPHEHPLAQLSNARKNFLLVIFAIATFVDVCNVSGVAVAVAQIGNDTGLHVSQLVWVSLVLTQRLFG